ncbi:MAG: leucine--tRNA ligase, partial [Schleiferiaceae bacterium]|nr:leucine--tRNA ligase [Schleiferiaceae bacterium]
MEYNHKDIEAKWQKIWAEEKTFKAEEHSKLPKYYVLDMFPYPSGAGLHVGHPLGYIASDIYSRYKRHKGFNVLHPMGYDSFGLPAEQYAIQTGQHPAITTENNIARYREQLDKIGFSFDWDREVRTSNPDYYRWTQWIFKQFFNAWYNTSADKAENIETLIAHFEANGTSDLTAAQTEELSFTAEEWKGFDEQKQSDILLNYRLAYRSESMVNWCPELGTVLANDEVKDGVSERGGYPVVQKKMMQWSMRISAYAQRLLDGLDTIDWSTALKESQRNWIGRSEGASLEFKIQDSTSKIEVFTTRPDTIFGVRFMTLAPEHELVNAITTEEYKDAVRAYKEMAARRSERDRMADTKTISGQFTGAYAVHPFNGELIPIWIGDYVLASYGTGAVMAVPGHDSRDWAFAKHFDLPIKEVVAGGNITETAHEVKDGTIVNSDFITDMAVADAVKAVCDKAEEMGIGEAKINYRLRDAIFGRQRYWGEPIPVYYENDIPKLMDDADLPLNLPEVDKYLPTEDGEPPLARAKVFTYKGFEVETTTMPGWAGSSWYFLRYMDAQNDGSFVSNEAMEYWQNVDLYIGGSEHATGHLLYARFWHKFFEDMGLVNSQEPFKKLINQGMIQGTSALVFRVKGENKFISKGLKDSYDTYPLHADVNLVNGSELNIEGFKNWRVEFNDAEFVLEDGKYIVGHEVEKMSKRWYNVVNPDDVISQYGADVLRMYEMFLGPLEQSKPWNTQGLSGVNGFFKKLWKLYQNGFSDEKATEGELKTLHACIKKVNEDIENF